MKTEIVETRSDTILSFPQDFKPVMFEENRRANYFLLVLESSDENLSLEKIIETYPDPETGELIQETRESFGFGVNARHSQVTTLRGNAINKDFCRCPRELV